MSRHFCSASRGTRVEEKRFAANPVRLQLHALAYNLANFLRVLGTQPARYREAYLASRARGGREGREA